MWALVGRSVSFPAPRSSFAPTPVDSPVTANVSLSLFFSMSAPKRDTSKVTVFSAGTPLIEAAMPRFFTESTSPFAWVTVTETSATSSAWSATKRAFFFADGELGFFGFGLTSFCKLLVPSAYFSTFRRTPRSATRSSTTSPRRSAPQAGATVSSSRRTHLFAGGVGDHDAPDGDASEQRVVELAQGELPVQPLGRRALDATAHEALAGTGVQEDHDHRDRKDHGAEAPKAPPDSTPGPRIAQKASPILRNTR